MTRYLVVCLGNICARPLVRAGFAFRHGAGPSGQVDSAGTSGYHAGDPPDRRSVATMRTVDMTFRASSRKFVRADFQKFDRILVMDRANLADVLSLARSEEEREKVALFDRQEPKCPIPTMEARTVLRWCESRSGKRRSPVGL